MLSLFAVNTSRQKSLVKQSQLVQRQNPTPDDVTNVFEEEVTTFNLLGMAPPAMLLLLAVVGFLKAEVVLEVVQVEVEVVLAELEVVLEALQVGGGEVVLLPIVSFLNNLILLLPTELSSPVDIFAAALVLVVVLLVVAWLLLVGVVLMLPELGLSLRFPILALAL